ncbi:proteasome subunit alpha type-3 [Phakopsora pachyrhizi]|nr:proteasome subunit alpha type-3 [Phakopsora pachyrhizi]KAI8461407.1 proteasome subunit alpha type-3 [Phakopsora pachyrhizi]
MTSIGTGYDLSASTYSPDGRIFQIEYANKAVENSGTVIGLKFKDGVVLAVEKLVQSKLLVPGNNKRLKAVDLHAGIATAGLLADGRQIGHRAADEAASYKQNYNQPIPLKQLADRLGQFCQAYTLYGSVRPFGISTLIAGLDPDGTPNLFCLEPSGVFWGYRGCAIGKGRTLARTEIEKLKLEEMTAREAVDEAARMQVKDKDFELEMSWISKSETNGKQVPVPKSIIEAAEVKAKESLSSEMED